MKNHATSSFCQSPDIVDWNVFDSVPYLQIWHFCRKGLIGNSLNLKSCIANDISQYDGNGSTDMRIVKQLLHVLDILFRCRNARKCIYMSN